VRLSEILIGALVSLIALVAISYIVEMLRPTPKRPEKLVWAPAIPIQYVDIGGVKVRYINTGVGANLVLLHTLRTHLDVFEKIIPELASRFTVYAYDYPGHGWSDIPKAAYSPTISTSGQRRSSKNSTFARRQSSASRSAERFR
jgi:alpha-beta hydrolase superfamily lysophospholipase